MTSTKPRKTVIKSPRRRGQVPWMLTVSPMDWLPARPWRLGVCEETSKGMTEVGHFRYDTEEAAMSAARWLEAMADG